MAPLRQAGSSAFCFAISCGRVLFAVGGEFTDRVSSGVGFAAGRANSRRLSASAVEAEGEGEPIPAWKFWKIKAEAETREARAQAEIREAKAEVETERMKTELWKIKAETREARAQAEIREAKVEVEIERMKIELWKGRCDANAKEYLISIQNARLEILHHKYQLKARGIPELFIRSLTREALLHCSKKEEDEHLPENERKFYKDIALNWFPQARMEIWRIILEMPTMIGFKEDMQKVLSSQNLDLLVMKATAFHKEFRHFHHSGVRRREDVTFVREHIQQGIQDRLVDPVHLEGFMQAMAKKINVNVRFVDERDVNDCADE